MLIVAVISGIIFVFSFSVMIWFASNYTFAPEELESIFNLSTAGSFISCVPFLICTLVLVKHRKKKTPEDIAEKRCVTLRNVMTYAAPAAFVALGILLQSFLLFLLALLTFWLARATREKSPKVMGRLLACIGAVPLLIFIVIGIIRIHFAQFNAIDLENANPDATGTMVICYDAEAKRYNNRYTPDGYRAKKVSEAGYVVLYSRGTRGEYYTYSAGRRSSRVLVTLQTFNLSLYDVKQGRIIKTDEMRSRPPSSVSEDTRRTKSYFDPVQVQSTVKNMLPQAAGPAK